MLLAASLLVAFLTQQDAPAPPKWEDYPAREPVWKGPNATPKLVRADERMFQTRLTSAAKEPPDFAGHYRFAGWGCGSVCAAGALIDLKTGAVYPPPKVRQGGTGWSRWIFATGFIEGPYIEVKPTSRLAITRIQSRDLASQEIYYWEWTDSGFRLILKRIEKRL